MFRRYVNKIVMTKYETSTNKAKIDFKSNEVPNDQSSRKSDMGETSFLVTHRSPNPVMTTTSSPPPAKQTNEILKHFEMKYNKDSLFNHQWQQAHKRGGGVSFSQRHGI